MSRRVLINLLFFLGTSLVMAVWAVQNILNVEALEQPYSLEGDFAAGSGLTKNAQITYLGVPIGSVSSLEGIPGGVRVHMKIERGEQIPVGSTANILRKTAIGEPIVDFRPPPGGEGGAPIPPGTRIPMAQTTVPLEFSDLLRSASELIGSISPEALRTVLHESSIGLSGTSESFRELVDASDRLGQTLVTKDAAIRRLALNNTALVKLLADRSATIERSFEDLGKVADTLAAAKADTTKLLEASPLLLSELSTLVESSRTDIDCSLRVLGQVIDLTTTDKKLRELRALLDIGPRAFGGVWDSVDYEADGPWVRVNLTANATMNPARQYVPPKVLERADGPAVCAAGLGATPSGVDFTSPPRGGLPATGQEPALAIVAMLLAAAIVLRLVARSEG